MKPVVDYQVAAAVDPTPLSLLTPGPDYSKYHDTWLEDKWFPFMGFVLGYGSLWYTHAMSRRPFHAGLPLKLGVGIASATAAYYFKQYRTAYLADKDAMYRQYIHMHPESFLSPERTKVGDLFKEWVPLVFNTLENMVINYYSILCLKRHCTKDDVHKAFGKLVSKYSLISNVHDSSLIILCEAYEVLSDSFRRGLYDQYGEEGIKKGVHTSDLYIDPWIYHGDVLATYTEYCAHKNPISHLHLKFNGVVPLNFMKNQSHLDIVKLTLKLTLNEIFNGTTKLVPVKCRPQISDSKSTQMQVVRVHVPRGFPTGKTLKTEVTQIVDGFEEIKTLYEFTTEDIPHKVFKRDNMNLIMVQKVLLKQALYGTQISIKTLDRKVLRINITQVITHDYIKVIHNEGMPKMNDPTLRGNIIIKFDIVFPLYLPMNNEIFCKSVNNKINT